MYPGFFISLIIIIALQIGLQYLLIFLNVPVIWIGIIVDFALSVVFALFNFRGQEKLKNPNFHKTIAIYFVILTIFSIILGRYW